MRCFLCIELDDEIKNEIEKIKRDFNIQGIKLVKRENLHITVKFLGEINEETLNKILNLDLSVEELEVNILKMGVFPNEEYIRVIWIGLDDKLIPIFKEIDEKLGKLGFKKEKSYIPHITIGRVKFISNNNKIKIINNIKKYSNLNLGKMKIKHITLMKSTLTKSGPIYEVIKRW